MKILIADRLLDTPNFKQKEGEVLKSSFEKLGHCVTIAGKGYKNDELSIRTLAKDHDFVLITENYPIDWKWWDWNEITIPKYIWAIDYEPHTYGNRMAQFIVDTNFNAVFSVDHELCQYMEYNTGKKHYYLPYAILDECKEIACNKKIDLLFIGSPHKQRLDTFPSDTIYLNRIYDSKYYEAISSAKINLNLSPTNAANGKIFEAISTKAFILTNWTKQVYDLFDGYVDTYKNKEELKILCRQYINDDEYRNKRRIDLYEYCKRHHTYADRCNTILNVIK